jgi:uncharacterized protein YjbJ (UPF0337 family)
MRSHGLVPVEGEYLMKRLHWGVQRINRKECQLMSGIDKAKNTAEKLSGKAKETAGRATGNQRMQDEGKAKRAKAGMKQRGEKAKDVFRG